MFFLYIFFSRFIRLQILNSIYVLQRADLSHRTYTHESDCKNSPWLNWLNVFVKIIIIITFFPYLKTPDFIHKSENPAVLKYY